MKQKKLFDAALLAERVYKRRNTIFQQIREELAIQRYLISVRSRTEFVTFYKLRLQKAHADQLYRYLLRYMGRQTTPRISSVLAAIKRISGTIELANASKVIASLDRTKPVYDSVVRKHLGLSHPAGDMRKAIAIYQQLRERIAVLGKQTKIRAALRDFDRAFPQFRGGRFLSKTKKLDLLLWQMK
jgi:hypothetical protein